MLVSHQIIQSSIFAFMSEKPSRLLCLFYYCCSIDACEAMVRALVAVGVASNAVQFTQICNYLIQVSDEFRDDVSSVRMELTP